MEKKIKVFLEKNYGNLVTRLEDGDLFCAALDICDIVQIDDSQLRGMAKHVPEQLVFSSFVLGRNIRYSIPSFIKTMTGIEIVDERFIESRFNNLVNLLRNGKTMCGPSDAAEIFQCDPNTLRRSIRENYSTVGIKAMCSGSHIQIPIIPLITKVADVSFEKVISIL